MKPPHEYTNIVFDMGRVLCDYTSRNSIARLTGDEKVIDEIRWIIYCSEEWQMIDIGLVDEHAALEYAMHRLSSDAVRDLARESLLHWEDYNLSPKPGMDGVVRALKGRGQRVYVLSNASLRLRSCWQRVFPAPECYDGLLFSAEVQCIKPQKWIYQIFFERFGLNPAECLFIDDLERNVAGSIACGMDAWQFASGDVAELRRFLELDPA